jgi:hypothetical protein
MALWLRVGAMPWFIVLWHSNEVAVFVYCLRQVWVIHQSADYHLSVIGSVERIL